MSPYNVYQFSEDDVSVDTEIEFYNVPDQRILDMLVEVFVVAE